MRLHSPILITLVCLIALTGCGKRSEERSIEEALEKSSGGKAKVDLSKNKFEIKTAEGKFKMSSGEGVEIPAGFPKDVYVYAEAKTISSMALPKGNMLVLESKDPAAKVVKAYESKMSDHGWKKEMEMDSGGTSMFVFKKDKLSAQVTIASDSDNGKTTISVLANAED